MPPRPGQGHMLTALTEAEAAAARGEVPVGAVVVDANGAVLAQAGNRTRELADPTAHAEMLAIRAACQTLGSERLGEADLYVTLEPCPMCMGALLSSDVEELVFAVPNRTDGAAGTMLQLAEHPGLRRRVRVVSGIRRDEVEELYAAAAR